MRSVKTLILGITLAAAAPNLRAQDAGGAAQQVRRSAEQAAQTAAPASKQNPKPAAQAPSKPATPAPKNSAAGNPPAKSPAQAAAGKPTGAAKSPTPQAAKPATPGTKAAAGSKPPAKAQAAATKKPAKKPGAKRVVKAKSSAAENAQATLEHESQTRVARRDPFEAMLGRENAGASRGSINLPSGKAGLQVSTLRLDGVVRAPNGMIAVVSNPQSRTYFLREGDQLYDGRVEKIAMDGVSFHEVGKDAFGKPVERQVNKRIYASAGEQQ
jgi:hypothetical protein